MSKLEKLIQQKKNRRKWNASVGIHSEYIIDLLELCKSSINFSQLRITCLIKFKPTFLRILTWATLTGLLRRTEDDIYVYYVLTSKGRDFLDILEKLHNG